MYSVEGGTETDLDHVGRGKREPLVQTDVLVDVRVEDLKVLHRRVTCVLYVVPE